MLRTVIGWIGTGLALAVAAVATAKPQEATDLVVHEWGTFLAMQGGDGLTLDGMYHEEHALPPFVHARSRDQLCLPSVVLKGETPVIYFYTPAQQEVRVEVNFPRGNWTQWYPQAGVVGPQFAAAGSPPQLRNGRIIWRAEILPHLPVSASAALPRTASDALWNYARDVDAAFVRTRNRTLDGEPEEYERFLFYRGLGEAPLPIRMTSAGEGTLSCATGLPEGVRQLFVLRVEKGRAAFRYFPSLSPGAPLASVVPPAKEALPLDQFTPKIGDALAARLVESGLYPKEARAMVNTWRTSYFRTEGVRVLFVLPQAWTDRFIPMAVEPQPKQLVRVMVGRLELLTPERERQAESAVRDLAAADAAVRERAFNTLREQGRYVEPILRRLLRTTQDESLRTLARRLLLTDFVTELRAATHSATTGERRRDDPVYVRAQLASLLREVGLDQEARAEAETVRAALAQRASPDLRSHEARHSLRAEARAMEGLGDDAAAADRYETFIRFASQVKVKEECRGCHGESGVQGPREMAWFRDWWAGRRLALALARSGRTEATIARQEHLLASHPDDPAAQLMLAYLYEAKGEKEKSTHLWAHLSGTTVSSLSRRAGDTR
jgi:hypothetical protein